MACGARTELAGHSCTSNGCAECGHITDTTCNGCGRWLCRFYWCDGRGEARPPPPQPLARTSRGQAHAAAPEALEAQSTFYARCRSCGFWWLTAHATSDHVCEICVGVARLQAVGPRCKNATALSHVVRVLNSLTDLVEEAESADGASDSGWDPAPTG